MSSAAKVGVFVLVILVILGFFILRIEDINLGRAGRTKKIDVIFDSSHVTSSPMAPLSPCSAPPSS